MTGETGKRSDLGVRTASAIVMVAVAGGALWAGGLVFLAFSLLLAVGLLLEWWRLSDRMTSSLLPKSLWMLGGVFYIVSAIWALVTMRSYETGLTDVLMPILLVISVDIGAYFAGRAIGGPKIAPSISPNKTWAGLLGGIISASIVCFVYIVNTRSDFSSTDLRWFVAFFAIMIGVIVGVTAQAGDFLESWMKRKAGVKDSGNLIPGHGGLLDRADGMIAVFFVISLFAMANPSDFAPVKRTVTIVIPKR